LDFQRAFFLKRIAMKHATWIGLAVYLLLIVVCFMPWTYHADLDKNFTGFFSEKDVYGKPGKFIIIGSLICVAMIFIKQVWAKFVHLFFAGFMLAYALKSYHLYTSSYNAYTPEKQFGIYALVLLSVFSFLVALFPDMKLKKG
jgi:hypothetical protein